MIPVAKTMTTAAAAELLCDIAERLAESRGRTIIAIDGRCAGGKTTLAHAQRSCSSRAASRAERCTPMIFSFVRSSAPSSG